MSLFSKLTAIANKSISAFFKKDVTRVKTKTFPSDMDGIKSEFLFISKNGDGSYSLGVAGQIERPIGFETFQTTGNWMSRPLAKQHHPLKLSEAFANNAPDKARIEDLPQAIEILKRYEAEKESVSSPIPDDSFTKQPHFSVLTQ